MTNAGRFVWDELVAADPGQASEFYRGLFGWVAQEMDMGEQGTYLVMKRGERMLAGIADGPDGVPQHWVSYLEVDDVDASAAKAKSLGGTLLGEPFDVPGVGRMVFAQEPTGGAFALMTSADPSGEAPAEPALHGVCWHELMTDDVAKASAFYEALVGYQAEPMGPDTVVLKQGDAMRATIRKKPMAAAPNHWLVYLLVEDVDASAKRASGLGAEVLMPTAEISGLGTFSVLKDPDGGVFALWKNAASA